MKSFLGRARSPLSQKILRGGILLAWALSSCAGLSGPLGPTPIPTDYLPTVIALTVAAGRKEQITPTPSATPTPTPTSVPPTLLHTPTRAASPTLQSTENTLSPTVRKITSTPTLTPTPPVPFAAIQIINPGPASRVVSPILFTAYLEPGAQGKVNIELLGEDGRLLVRNIKSFYASSRMYVNQEIEFEIAAVAEAGRLQISTRDEYGRVIALASIDLLLLSLGDAEINPPGDLQEKIVIQEPHPKALIQGGKMWVSGLARTSSTIPLIVEMFTTDGKRLGPTRLVNITESGIPGYSAFSTEMPYSLKSPAWVRLTVSEISGRIPGVTHYSSVEVLLSP